MPHMSDDPPQDETSESSGDPPTAPQPGDAPSPPPDGDAASTAKTGEAPRRRPRRRRRRKGPRPTGDAATPASGDGQGPATVAAGAPSPAGTAEPAPGQRPRARGPRRPAELYGPFRPRPRESAPPRAEQYGPFRPRRLREGAAPGAAPREPRRRERNPSDAGPREPRARTGAPPDRAARAPGPRDQGPRGQRPQGPGKRPDARRRDGPPPRPEPKLYTMELVVDRGFEDVPDEANEGATRRVNWTIVKRTVADQRSAKQVSANYVLRRDEVDTDFPSLSAARATVNKTIVHPEKLTRSKADHDAARAKSK